jgi:zinc protease
MKIKPEFLQRAFLAFTVGLFLSCAARVSQAQGLDRTKKPASGAPVTLRIPAMQMRALKNGIKVGVLEQHEIPLVAVRVVVDAAPVLDPAGKSGVSALTASMLGEGTTSRTADQLAEAFADLGNTVSPNGFTTVTANVDSSLALLADMLLHPAFPAASLERLRQNNLANIKRLRDNPQYMARRVEANVLWGAGHPYERTITEQSLGAITRDDLVAFHGKYYRPQNVKFVVSGDITPAAAVAKLEKAFGKWPAGGFKSRYVIPPAKTAAAGTVYLFDRPNSPQSILLVGAVGPARTSPDYYAIDLMNTTLGGAFSSRLNLNLREKHGFTYGANTGFQYRLPPQPGEFIASSAVTAGKTDSALVEMMHELRDIRATRALTPDELAFAKSSETKSLPLGFETIDQIANAGVNILRDGLPLDYYNTISGKLRAVTLAQANAAAKTYVDPSKLVIVVVGDRKEIEAGLRAAKLGPVVVVDENGAAVSK